MADEEREPQPLTRQQRESLRRQAELAGASEDELGQLEASFDKVTDEDIPQIGESIDQLRTRSIEVYTVVGPGTLRFGGKRLEAGSKVELTPQEAESLGDIVQPGKPPKPPPKAEKRRKGTYKVLGPGAIRVNGTRYNEGETVTLTEEEARSLTTVELQPVRAA